MKSVKKMYGALAVFALAVSMVLTGCPREPEETGKSDPVNNIVDYTEAGAEITVNAGEEAKTIYVKGASASEYTCNGLTITYEGNEKFTLKADEKTEDATVTVNFYDANNEGDEGINVTVYVYNPIYYVNMTLDDAIAEKAASISVYYEGKEDNEETAALKDTVDAIYKAGETTAVVSFKKEMANSYKWFNHISVTVKDSDGNVVESSCGTNYFCYTAKEGEDGYVGTMKVIAPISSKTFTIKFDGFTIPGGSVTGLRYSTAWASSSAYWDDSTVVTPAVTVADDGASATFVVENTDDFYINWTEVSFADKDGNTITISSGLTDSNKWYGYNSSELSITATVVSGTYTDLITDQSFTASSAYTQVLNADQFNGLSISTLKVTVKLTSATEWWASASSANEWAAATYQKLEWSDDAGGYTAIITGSDFISALAANGLYLNTYADAVGTVSVSYIK